MTQRLAPAFVALSLLTAPALWAASPAPQAPAQAPTSAAAPAAAPVTGSAPVSVMFSSAAAASVTPTAQQLLQPQPTDVVEGRADAPVTIIEYASLTCSHCAKFHTETLPQVKKNWVATGKAKYILRDMPWDNLALGMSALARCLPQPQQAAMYQRLFSSQRTILFNPNPLEALLPIAQEAGLGRAQVEACIRNAAVQQQLNRTKQLGFDVLAIRGTPTVFVNGERVDGFVDYKKFKPVLEKAYATAGAKPAAR